MANYVPPMVTVRVDLNALREDRLVAHRSAIMSPLVILGATAVQPGQHVRAVEEEGDSYTAIVEEVSGDLMRLRLRLDSLVPAVDIGSEPVTFDIEGFSVSMRPPVTETVHSKPDLADVG